MTFSPPLHARAVSGCSDLILFGDTDSFSFAVKFLGKKGPLFSGENPNQMAVAAKMALC